MRFARHWYGALLLAAIVLPLSSMAQTQPTSLEDKDLGQAIGEAGNSPVDLVHAIENHLAKYPNSPKKVELLRALSKGAMEINDDARIVRYGEIVLVSEPDDLRLLDRVSRALVALNDKAAAARALLYSRHFVELVDKMALQPPPARDAAKREEEFSRGRARAFLMQSRAQATLGKIDEAVNLAQRSFETYAYEEAAHELGSALSRAGRNDEALRAVADAFTIPDAHATDTDRQQDRKLLGELYRKTKPNESGLGDFILASYDRTTALVEARRAHYRAIDPNADLANPFDYTLTSIDGSTLRVGSLKGKVVVMDFWATWCTPCRAQHPLYEEVKKRFHGNQDVVFLAINTDEEHDQVKPFLLDQKWQGAVYFEDGLSRVLKVTSIPTTVIFDKRGEVGSRMIGYIPDRFVDMLTERVKELSKEGRADERK